MTNGNWPNPFFGFFVHLSSSSSSVKLAYRQSGSDGFYTKRLLSVACVILDQENLRNFTQNLFLESHFLYVHVRSKGGV